MYCMTPTAITKVAESKSKGVVNFRLIVVIQTLTSLTISLLRGNDFANNLPTSREFGHSSNGFNQVAPDPFKNSHLVSVLLNNKHFL